MKSGPAGGGREVRLPEVALERSLVAEPLGLLVGIDVAPHPRHERAVVQGVAFIVCQADPLAQRERDQALAQPMLHRLTHTEVRTERKDPEQLGKRHR